jgi:hypothetical protein
MLHALPLCDLGKAFALLLFTLDTSLPGVLQGKDAPCACQSYLERAQIIQVSLDNPRTLGCQRLRGSTSRIPRHRLDSYPFARSSRITAPPWLPVAPVTRIVSLSFCMACSICEGRVAVDWLGEALV